jgi:MerR family transcriptional regulator, light-induced transcriptional regulator
MDLESAAAVLGVHYQTAYRWVRTGLLPAVKVGAGYELDPDHVAVIAEERRHDRVVPVRPAPDWVAAHGALAGALASGDDVAARRLVERLQRDGAGPAAICDLVIAPTLRRLDGEWVAGSLLPGEVAVAAEICERLVGMLASPPRGRPRGLAIVASPDDERHRLPGLMATVALRADRWRVHHLGCGIPTVDLGEFVAAEQPDLLVLSFAAVPAGSVETVRAVTGAVPVLVGAPGATLAGLTADAQQLCATRRRSSGGATRGATAPSFTPAR